MCRKGGSLSNFVVLGAGHLVPRDQAILNSQAMVETGSWRDGYLAVNKGRINDNQIYGVPSKLIKFVLFFWL